MSRGASSTEKYQKPIITDRKDVYPETVVTATAIGLFAKKVFGDDVIKSVRAFNKPSVKQ